MNKCVFYFKSFNAKSLFITLSVAFLTLSCGLLEENIQDTSERPPKDFLVFGQPDFFSFVYNYGAGNPSGSNLSNPQGIDCGQGYCYVADSFNNRVLIYKTPMSSYPAPIGVLGQPDLETNTKNLGKRSASPLSLDGPIGVHISGSRFVLSDSNNNRILIYNSLPTTGKEKADVVVGQSDFASHFANQGLSAPTASTLNWPIWATTSGGKLLIADSYNHRVLVFNSIPTTNGAAADLVIGQADFVSDASNRGGGAAGNTLYMPTYVYVSSSGKLFISDHYNYRVLIWNTIPTTLETLANNVIGQSDLVSRTANTSQANNYGPFGVLEDSGALYISDWGNSRILYYSSTPTSDGVLADAAIGQSDWTSWATCDTNAATDSCMSNPPSFTISDGKFYVAGGYGHRISVYNTPPTSHTPADQIIGATDKTKIASNGNLNPNAKGMYWPTRLTVSQDWLIVAEKYNHRVTIRDKNDPTKDALFVLGQTDFNSMEINQGGSVAANTMQRPYDIAVFDQQLYVADKNNHRILVFDANNISNGMNASFVIGQPDFTSNSANQGGARGAKTLYGPFDLEIYNEKLWVMEYNNCRIVGYDLPITESNPSATFVIGQADFTAAVCTTNQNHFQNFGFGFINDKLITTSNGRTLFFDIPTTSGAALTATGVFGQADYTSNSANRGSADPGRNTLSGNESDVLEVDGYLLISDKDNHRVLVFKDMPNGIGAEADYVIGQESFTKTTRDYPANEAGDGPGFINAPIGMAKDDAFVYVAESWGNRVHKIRRSKLTTLFNE